MEQQRGFADEQGPSERENAQDGKRAFVEPEISAPEDVLEATTFFQGLTSGTTNIP